MFVPILLVLVPHAPGLERKRRIPIADRQLIGHARHLRRQIRVVCQSLQGHDLFQAKLGLRLLDFAVRALRLEVRDLDLVARLGPQVLGRPRVEHDLVVGQRLDRLSASGKQRPQRRLAHEVDGRDRRIGNLVAAAGDRVGQVGKQRLRPIRRKRLHRRAHHGRLNDHAVAGQLHVAQLVPLDFDAIVGQLRTQRLLERRVGRGRRCAIVASGHEDRVCLPALLQRVGQRLGRHECVERHQLARVERESAQSLGRNHGRHRQPAIPYGFGLAAQRAIGRYLARAAQPQQHLVAHLHADFLGQRRIEHDLARAGRLRGSAAAELPEIGSAAHDGHLPGPQSAVGVLDRSLHVDRRHG